MRLRLGGMACALALLGSLIAAGTASAAPQQNSGLTIAATPNPVIAGQGVLIYGRLLGTANGNQTIRLFHHLSDSNRGFTEIASTTTDALGYYELSLPPDRVYTNRGWFVRGPSGTQSRTVHEVVRPLVSVAASTTATSSNHAVVFTGHVTPNHRFEQVFLEQQIGSTDDWRTLRATTLNPASSYYVSWRWRHPGEHSLRVLFKADSRNGRGVSDPVMVVVQQAQVPGFTINTTEPFAASGGSVTISGVLNQSGTTQPDQGAIVQLWGSTPDHPFKVLADAVTASDGSYSFSQSSLTTNTIYEVRTMPDTHSSPRHTALLYQGVQDVVTMQTTSSTAGSGQPVMFTGTVQPDKSGRVIVLQILGNDGDWHNVELAIVQPGSTFQFIWTAAAPGVSELRARITGDEDNVGAASVPLNITAAAPPASSLPPAS